MLVSSFSVLKTFVENLIDKYDVMSLAIILLSEEVYVPQNLIKAPTEYVLTHG